MITPTNTSWVSWPRDTNVWLGFRSQTIGRRHCYSLNSAKRRKKKAAKSNTKFQFDFNLDCGGVFCDCLYVTGGVFFAQSTRIMERVVKSHERCRSIITEANEWQEGKCSFSFALSNILRFCFVELASICDISWRRPWVQAHINYGGGE